MRKILLVILVVSVLVPLAVYVHLRSYIPDYDREIEVSGLNEKVTIERNRYGVPSILAGNDEDLYFAWGFVNAQDRLFQMEITRRIAQGRLSEFAGPSTLKKDFFLRAVGFYEIAKHHQQNLPPRIRRALESYVEGVNYFLEKEKLPLYMKLLGLEAEKWEIADTAAVAMMLNWSLAYNMKHELIYTRMVEQLGRERAAELTNFVPPDTPTIVDDGGPAVSDRVFSTMMHEMGPFLGCTSASNNWVIGPSRTTNGETIFCSDMHVHQSKLPSDFYYIHVKGPDYEAAGAQVAGLPFIAAGYNRDIAWANTNQGADTVDLFAETVDWDKETYRHGGRDIPLGKKEEIFQVKGQDPVKKTLYNAGRKPILNDVFPELDFTVSLDWAGFDGINVEGFFHINRAKDYESFLEGARQIRMTPQNMVYADRHGNIAYRVVGSLPNRIKGTGNFPQNGEVVRSNWNGNVPDHAYPCIKNPERGYIITANNKVVQDYEYEMNGVFAPAYRYENIATMIRDKDGIDVDYMKQVQTDTRTVLADKVIPILEEHIRPGGDPRVAEALALVMEWDGDNLRESVAASIYNTFLVRFIYQTLKDEIGEGTAKQYISERYISMERFFKLLTDNSDFFDDVTTPEQETVADMVNRAFQETLKILERHSGSSDMARWTWGTFHVLRLDHFLGRSKLLAPFVNYGPFPFEGDCETNNRARFLEVEPPFVADSASAPRMIVRFDPDPKGYMMLVTGENEYFLSPHRTDMTEAWLRKEYFCLEEEEPAYRTVMLPAE